MNTPTYHHLSEAVIALCGEESQDDAFVQIEVLQALTELGILYNENGRLQVSDLGWDVADQLEDGHHVALLEPRRPK